MKDNTIVAVIRTKGISGKKLAVEICGSKSSIAEEGFRADRQMVAKKSFGESDAKVVSLIDLTSSMESDFFSRTISGCFFRFFAKLDGSIWGNTEHNIDITEMLVDIEII